MQNIISYFANLYNLTESETEYETIADYEQEVFEMEDLTQWATENGINLTAVDEKTGQTFLQLWAWDMDGE